MKSLKYILPALLLIVFLLCELKGCIKTTIGFEKHEVYENISKNGQKNRVFIIPHNELILSKNYQDNFELGLYRVRGSNITHYFGSLYNVSESLSGLRIYSKANEAWNAELELKEKVGNISETSFGDRGKRYNVRIICYPDSIKIDGDTYNKIDMSEFEIRLLREMFNSKETREVFNTDK